MYRYIIFAFCFLNDNTTYDAIIYKDGAGADWKTLPESYEIVRTKVKKGDVLKIQR